MQPAKGPPSISQNGSEVNSVKRKVLFGDCDPAGIVYTPVVGYYVAEAVQEFFSQRLGRSALRRIFELGILPPARNLSIDFTYPMRWDDEIEIFVSVKEIKSRSFTFGVLAMLNPRVGSEAPRLAFSATLTQVCVSPETLQPVEIPAVLRRELEEMLSEPGSAG